MDVGDRSSGKSEDHVTSHLRQAAQSPGVLVPSVLAWRVLIILPLLLWTWSVIWGMSAFDGIPENRRAARHFMMWFDVLVFRTPAGPALPFIILAVRWLSTAGLRREGIQSVAPTVISKVLVPYLVVTLGRMLLYGVHAWWQASHRLSHDASHVVPVKAEEAASESIAYLSDHILLGASVVALLHSEMICAVSDMIKLAAVTDSDWRVMVAASALMKSILLLVLVVLDMHWTARLFHYPAESAVAFAAGLLLFQVPILLLLKHWRFTS